MSIEFKLTRDPGLLEQYYTLREQCFREELGIPDFDGSEEYDDRQGQILVAVQDGRCIGGARISPTVTLRSQVKQLELNERACCMWERLVFDPAARTLQLLRDFCARLIQFSQQIGYHHAMLVSSLRNARFYRQCHSAVGVEFNIHRHVPHSAKGAFAGLEHYLSVAHLQEAQPLRLAADTQSSFRSAVM
jgi:N-acyl-L-homoserine lactone synthetase